jgi:multidrug efflux pump subunit AcrA (membrane-fusion protein)
LLPALGCNRKPGPAGGAAPAGTQISVVKPEARAVKRVVEQPGTVLAFEETALHANLTGYLDAIELDPNKKDRPADDRFIDIDSRVKQGQVLARIAKPELDKEWEQKTALVKQAAVEIVQAEKAHAAAAAEVDAATSLVAVADAAVDHAQALCERSQKEVVRVSKQLAGGVDTSQALDDAQLQLKAAEATRKGAIARVASAKAAVDKAKADEGKAAADVDAAKARQEVARADVARVEALRSYTKIVAPFDGVVTRRSVHRGAFVTAGDRVALFNVARINPVRVVVNVPEADAGLVAVGQEVRLTLQGTGGTESTGKVTRTSWSLEPGSRTLRTEIDVPNETGQVRPGMYAYARLTAELPAAWSVPATAVGKVNDEPVIYLVEGGKAVRVSVQLGRGDGQFTQISRYKKPGATAWTDVTGSEAIATPAAALTDGRAVP